MRNLRRAINDVCVSQTVMEEVCEEVNTPNCQTVDEPVCEDVDEQVCDEDKQLDPQTKCELVEEEQWQVHNTLS